MAPKKKSKSSKSERGSSGIIDGISITEMSREQLESFVSRIQLELEREREERNFFQLERDKIRTFWEITRQQLEEAQAYMKNKDRELENSEDQHQGEMKICEQKVKHLMYEQHTELSQIKIKNMITLKSVENAFSERELQLIDEKREISSEKMENEKSYFSQIRSQVMDSNEKISNIRASYENNSRILEVKYQRCMEQFREELEYKNEIEVNEIEERKNNYIKLLIENHDEMYESIIRFYTDITAKNLALVSVLKDKLLKIKDEKYKMMHDMQFLRTQNQTLVRPLEIARKNIMELQEKNHIFERDQKRFNILEKQHHNFKKKLDDLQYSYNNLTCCYEQLKNEKEEIQRNFNCDFLELQRKVVHQNTILEQKISELRNIVELKEAQIIDLIIGDNDNNFMENSRMMQVTLNEKNAKISSLTEELSVLMKTHNSIIQNYKIDVLKNI